MTETPDQIFTPDLDQHLNAVEQEERLTTEAFNSFATERGLGTIDKHRLRESLPDVIDALRSGYETDSPLHAVFTKPIGEGDDAKLAARLAEIADEMTPFRELNRAEQIEIERRAHARPAPKQNKPEKHGSEMSKAELVAAMRERRERRKQEQTQ